MDERVRYIDRQIRLTARYSASKCSQERDVVPDVRVSMRAENTRTTPSLTRREDAHERDHVYRSWSPETPDVLRRPGDLSVLGPLINRACSWEPAVNPEWVCML